MCLNCELLEHRIVGLEDRLTHARNSVDAELLDRVFWLSCSTESHARIERIIQNTRDDPSGSIMELIRQVLDTDSPLRCEFKPACYRRQPLPVSPCPRVPASPSVLP
jgi:hypothetical protein